jgi:enoyl-CoA hydratase
MNDVHATYETLLLETRDAAGTGAIRVLRMNRPAVMNAMNTRMFLEMREALRALREDPLVRCVVLAASGTRAFSAGGDLKERNGMDGETWRRQHELIEEVFLGVHDFPLPIIAAVEGVAYGGGCEIALMCDFIVCGESARFALPEVTRGIMPGGGGIQNLTRAIGTRRAKQLLFTGAPFDAKRALALGVVNEVVPEGGAVDAAVAITEVILRSAPMSVKYLKLAASRGTEVDFHTGYALDIAAYNIVAASEDRREGVAAFNEKRPPNWRNR